MGCDSTYYPTKICRRQDCGRPALSQSSPLGTENYDGLCKEDWQQQLSQLVKAAMTGKTPEQLLRELVTSNIMLQRAVQRLEVR